MRLRAATKQKERHQKKVQFNQSAKKVVTNDSIGTFSPGLYILYFLKLPAPPRADLSGIPGSSRYVKLLPFWLGFFGGEKAQILHTKGRSRHNRVSKGRRFSTQLNIHQKDQQRVARWRRSCKACSCLQGSFLAVVHPLRGLSSGKLINMAG